MSASAELASLADEIAMRRLISRYAQCCDTRDTEGFGALFTPDAVLEGPGFRFATPAQISSVPQQLRQFAKTYHSLLNFLVEVNGDRAEGETYSMSHHLTPGAAGDFDDLVMYITYRDRFVRSASGWKFEHRKVVLEFTERRTVARTESLAELRK
jgi:hypothetical protein